MYVEKTGLGPFETAHLEARPDGRFTVDTGASSMGPGLETVLAQILGETLGLAADRFEVRYVSANGGIRWNSRWVNVSTVCVGEYVGLEEIDDGIWTVYFGPLRLGRLSERHMRIEDEYGRLYRRHV